jgi:hypothetical protein
LEVTRLEITASSMSSYTSIAPSGSSSASETVITNAFFPGQSFQLQRYQSYAGEWLKESADRHVIVQICESAASAERRSADGSWVQFLKEPGSLRTSLARSLWRWIVSPPKVLAFKAVFVMHPSQVE